MNSREGIFAEAVEIVASGASLDILGDDGSGRTHLLERIAAHFRNRAWRTLLLRGGASLSGVPLAPLTLAGVGRDRDPRGTVIPQVIAELRDLLPAGHSLILVDAWDAIDEGTWGVLCAFRAETKVPIVSARLATRRTRHTPTGLDSATPGTSLLVELPPMRFDELEAVLAERLGQPIDAASLSRIYATAGGNVGLAIALTEAARRERHLLLEDGRWRATYDLWSGSLRNRMERLLVPLDRRQRDILEILSLLGVVDAETADRFATASELEALEDASLIELHLSGTRLLVGVRPPLLAEYFRHVTQVSRRRRLRGVIRDALDPDGALTLAEPFAIDDGEPAPQFIRLVHEQQRTRILVATSKWQSERTLEAANAYLAAILDSQTGPDELEGAFTRTEDAPGTDEERAVWLCLRADHIAYNLHDPQRALELLERSDDLAEPARLVLVARAAEIETDLIATPDPATVPAPEAAPDSRSRIALHRAHALIATVQGRIDDSDRHIEALAELAGDNSDLLVATVATMNLVAHAHLGEAAALTARGLDESRARLDGVAMRAYGAMEAFVAITDGRLAEVEHVLDQVLALGQPVLRPPFAQLTLHIVGSVTASRRSQRKTTERRLVDTERLETPNGPLPGEDRSWAEASAAASSGERKQAADIAWESSERLWARGALLSGALGFLASVELDPAGGRYSAARDRIVSVRCELVEQHVTYVEALVAGEPERLESTGETLLAQGRIGIGLSALTRAGDILEAEGRLDDAARVRALRERRRASTATGHDTERWRARYIDLTDREREIALLAAAGLTNQQIADELVLSVRTVESHLLRVMRKTGTDRRSQLRSTLERADLTR